MPKNAEELENAILKYGRQKPIEAAPQITRRDMAPKAFEVLDALAQDHWQAHKNRPQGGTCYCCDVSWPCDVARYILTLGEGK